MLSRAALLGVLVVAHVYVGFMPAVRATSSAIFPMQSTSVNPISCSY